MVSWLQAGLTLSWLAWIAAGSLLHLSLLWKDKLPSLLVEAMTYGKLRAGRREHYSFFSVPKRCVWVCDIITKRLVIPLQVVHSLLRLGHTVELFHTLPVCLSLSSLLASIAAPWCHC